MVIPNVFNLETVEVLKKRIDQLTSNSQPLWGKMSVGQMLAHCNVTYEMVYENKHAKPNFFMGLILKAFIKKGVTNDVPYKKNSQTAPAFIIKETRIFEVEKNRLFAYLTKTQELGEAYFDNKESHSFGPLNKQEWSNLFYKHIDHHLTQFGV